MVIITDKKTQMSMVIITDQKITNEYGNYLILMCMVIITDQL